MTDEEKCRFLEELWKKAADEAQASTMRLTASVQGGRKINEKLESYVKRVRTMQDKELEKYNYALCELLKLGIHYE